MSKQLMVMTDKEIERVKIIEENLSKKIKQSEVADKLGISVRQVKRLKRAYIKFGVTGLTHGLRGKTSNHQFPSMQLTVIKKLIKEKYRTNTPTFVFEMLTQIDYHFKISLEAVRRIMISQGYWQAKVKKRVICHPLRQRRSREGELVQLDGSPNYYLGQEFGECCLLVFVDDATGKIFAYLCQVEDTINYFRAMKPYFLKHGLPRAFYVDRFSVFAPTPNGDKQFANNTQFYRVCQELNIELILASSPQAKGRVERANDTLQGRLIQMFAHRKFTSFKEANDYLQNFYLDFINTKFAVVPSSATRVSRFVSKERLDEVLVLKQIRHLSKNLTCHFASSTYQLIPNKGQSRLALSAKQFVYVITNLDGQIHLKVATPKGLVELRYTVIQSTKAASVISRKQVDLYLRKLSEALPAPTTPKNPWEEYYG
jgi:DNA-binding CsgD family transcriptional regulator